MTDVFVVDATIVIQSVIADTYSVNTDALFAAFKVSGTLWIPEFCRLECINVLWKQVRFHGMLQLQAEQAVKDILELPLKMAVISDVYHRALQIGLTHRLAVYDSVYIALAKNLACPLITVDEAQRRAAFAEGIVVKPITDFTS